MKQQYNGPPVIDDRPAPTQQPTTSILDRFKITRGTGGKGDRILIYGAGGMGKTTLASMFPKPVVIDLEGGTKHLNVDKIDMEGASLQDVEQVLSSKEIFADFDTIILDSDTKLEELISAHVCAEANVKSIEDIEYKAGYSRKVEHFIRFISYLDPLLSLGKTIIHIAHDAVRTLKNPDGSDYSITEPRLYSNANKTHESIRHRICEDCDHVLFLKRNVNVEKGKASQGDIRAIYTQGTPSFLAKSRLPLKNRYPFPEPMPGQTHPLIQDILSHKDAIK